MQELTLPSTKPWRTKSARNSAVRRNHLTHWCSWVAAPFPLVADNLPLILLPSYEPNSSHRWRNALFFYENLWPLAGWSGVEALLTCGTNACVWPRALYRADRGRAGPLSRNCSQLLQGRSRRLYFLLCIWAVTSAPWTQDDLRLVEPIQWTFKIRQSWKLVMAAHFFRPKVVIK